MSTQIVQQQPLQPQPTQPVSSIPSDQSNDNKSDEKTSLSTYIIIALVVFGIISMLYYAYTIYLQNSTQESFVEGNRQERDDPVADFNLQAALNDLDAIQRSILKKLSSDTGM